MEAYTLNPRVYAALFPEKYMEKCVQSELRLDTRRFHEFRTVSIASHVIPTCASSSLVKFDRLTIMTGITLAVTAPSIAHPSDGNVVVQVHLTPVCSAEYIHDRAPEEAQRLSSLLRRVIQR